MNQGLARPAVVDILQLTYRDGLLASFDHHRLLLGDRHGGVGDGIAVGGISYGATSTPRSEITPERSSYPQSLHVTESSRTVFRSQGPNFEQSTPSPNS